MQWTFVVVGSALFCAFSRAALTVFDRMFFQKLNMDFQKGILYNALFPFGFAVLQCWWMQGLNENILSLLIHPGVICSGLGAQIAAYTATQCLRTLHVRKVVISSKTSDILIPLALFGLNGTFCLQEYILSSFTTLAFFPIALLISKTDKIYTSSSYFFIGSLILQALINSYFHISSLATTWLDFSMLMVGILFWRATCMSIPVLLQSFLFRKTPLRPLNLTILKTLCLRGALAFLSQAAFFFSITRENNLVAWPILNATPILSCFLAHFFLQEKVGKSEFQAVGCFVLIFFIYIIMKGGF